MLTGTLTVTQHDWLVGMWGLCGEESVISEVLSDGCVNYIIQYNKTVLFLHGKFVCSIQCRYRQIIQK